jgi:hypothetical protein
MSPEPLRRERVNARQRERLKPPLGLRQALSRAEARREQGFRSVVVIPREAPRETGFSRANLRAD